MRANHQLAGMRFGRLVAERRDDSNHRHPMWICHCDCGLNCLVQAANLVSGNTRSCGCLRADLLRSRPNCHGKSRTKVYVAWLKAKQRCRDFTAAEFADYGGRGISFCERWNDFKLFLADMGEPPTKHHSLDRVDVHRGYEPGNCRWAVKRTQANNTRANHFLTFDGHRLTLAEWERRTGISQKCILSRIVRLGWSVEKALTTPARAIRRPY